MANISVVIPMFNSQPWIERTLDSVRNQSYPAEKLQIIGRRLPKC